MVLKGAAEQQWVTRCEQETCLLGQQIAATLTAPAVVLLHGPLGAGKTVLTRGLAIGLGLENPDEVRSPSFTLVNDYQGRCRIHHLDLYRLEGRRDLEGIGIEEILADCAVVVVEWGEKLLPPPRGALHIWIEDLGDDRRRITTAGVTA